MTGLITAVTAIILFGVIVLVHELGHFLTARWVGIPAEEFSIGMGPKLVQYKGKNTVFSIRALPIGGYVKFIGEDEDSDDPRAFGNATVWRRALVLASGALMNFILGILLISVFFVFFGVYQTSTDILEVAEGSPAYNAGLQAKDKIIEINDISLENKGENEGIEYFKNIINTQGEKPIQLTVKRGDQRKHFTLNPQYNEESNTYQIGIVFGRLKRYDPLSGLGMAVVQTGRLIIIMLQMLGGLIFKGMGLQEIVGPVGIMGEIGKAVKAGAQDVIHLAIVITLNLGIINLIPFPAMDGGRLALLLVEGVRGKPIDPKKEGYIHLIGFVILILLMVLVTVKDVGKLWM